jgi:DDE superfamily endonuclease
VCARSFAPAPGWSVDGHRIKAPLEYGRGHDKTWVYGALCVRDGQALTLSAPSRNTAGYLQLLEAIEHAYPCGKLTLISDNLSSHKSRPIQVWLAEHPRIQQLFIPVKAAWLNLMEPWWRLLRREAFAGQCFVDTQEVNHAAADATRRLNARAKPWVWGRPARTPRKRRRAFVYRL